MKYFVSLIMILTPILVFFDDFFRELMKKIDPEVFSKIAGCLLIAIMAGVAIFAVNESKPEKSRWENKD